MNLSVIQNRTKDHVIVVGSGIAGLATAVRLAHEGFSVTVLEQHDAPGGKIRSMPSAAGPIDAGPTVLTLRVIFDELFQAIGERLENHLILIRQKILARHWWPDGSSLDLYDDYEATQQAVYDFAGLTGFKQFQKFFQKTQRLFETFDKPMMQTGEPSRWDLAKLIMKHPTLTRDIAPMSTMASKLAKYFSDPRLAQLFGRYATYVGGSPYASPALLSLIWQAEAKGVWSVQGGMHVLATTLMSLAKERGVNFSFNCKVNKILLSDGHVDGVALENGKQLKSNLIVFNGDPRALATGELGQDFKNIAKESVLDERSLSARVWSFEAEPKGPDLIHHNVFFAADAESEFEDIKKGQMPLQPTIYVCAQDRGLNADYPVRERFEIILNAPAVSKAKHIDEEFEKCRTLTMTTLERFGLTFQPIPDKNSLTTPADFAAMFPASDGSLYGQSPHGLTAAFRRPTSRTAVPGLYLAGGGAHPGAGLPMATLSARHAVEAILKDRTSTLLSPQMATLGGMSMASARPPTAQFRSSDS